MLLKDEEILLTNHYLKHLFGVTLAVQPSLMCSLQGRKKEASVLIMVFLPCQDLKTRRQMSSILSLSPLFKDLIL